MAVHFVVRSPMVQALWSRLYGEALWWFATNQLFSSTCALLQRLCVFLLAGSVRWCKSLWHCFSQDAGSLAMTVTLLVHTDGLEKRHALPTCSFWRLHSCKCLCNQCVTYVVRSLKQSHWSQSHGPRAMKRPWIPPVVDKADLSTPRGSTASAAIQQRQKKRRLRDGDREEPFALLDAMMLQMARSSSLEEWCRGRDVEPRLANQAWKRTSLVLEGRGQEITLSQDQAKRHSCCICSAPIVTFCVCGASLLAHRNHKPAEVRKFLHFVCVASPVTTLSDCHDNQLSVQLARDTLGQAPTILCIIRFVLLAALTGKAETVEAAASSLRSGKWQALQDDLDSLPSIFRHKQRTGIKANGFDVCAAMRAFIDAAAGRNGLPALLNRLKLSEPAERRQSALRQVVAGLTQGWKVPKIGDDQNLLSKEDPGIDFGHRDCTSPPCHWQGRSARPGRHLPHPRPQPQGLETDVSIPAEKAGACSYSAALKIHGNGPAGYYCPSSSTLFLRPKWSQAQVVMSWRTRERYRGEICWIRRFGRFTSVYLPPVPISCHLSWVNNRLLSCNHVSAIARRPRVPSQILATGAVVKAHADVSPHLDHIFTQQVSTTNIGRLGSIPPWSCAASWLLWLYWLYWLHWLQCFSGFMGFVGLHDDRTQPTATTNFDNEQKCKGNAQKTTVSFTTECAVSGTQIFLPEYCK